MSSGFSENKGLWGLFSWAHKTSSGSTLFCIFRANKPRRARTLKLRGDWGGGNEIYFSHGVGKSFKLSAQDNASVRHLLGDL